ncbi:MAG: bactofilin family protein [Blastocatellia bacterium]
MATGWFKKDEGDWSGFLERGVQFEGRLESSGTLRVDSTVKGTLISTETLILGEHSVMEGQAEGNHVIIAGKFDGTVRGKSKVEIQPKAIVTGEIHTPCLVIGTGALFDGQCHMLRTAHAGSVTIAIPIRSAHRPA